MAFTSIHEIGKARELIFNLETAIGFDNETGLIKAARFEDDPDAGHLDTFENISFAINYALLGNSEGAQKILAAVENFIGKDSATGLFFNKSGVGKHEEKKVLPGEKTIYLSNQALIFILLSLLKKQREADEIFKLIKNNFQKFSFQKKLVYQHAIGLSVFYAFNNLFMAIAEIMRGDKKKSINLVNDIIDLCWDNNINLLTSAPDEKLYFILDNVLLAWWYKLQGESGECRKILKTIEEKVEQDKKTKLFYRGIKNIKDGLEQMPPALTYTNSVLTISYLVSADLFPKFI